MYRESIARKIAHSVLSRTLGVTRDESVTIDTWSSTLPWANAFVLEAYRLGARPILLCQDEDTFWRSLEETGPGALDGYGPAEWALLERTHAYVSFWGPSDVGREFALPLPTRERITAYMQRWRTAANRVGLRLASLYIGRVNPRTAATKGISAEAWTRELVEASLVDPAVMQRQGDRLARRLRSGSELTIDHPNGTHLQLRLKKREAFVYGGILERPRDASRRPLGWRPRLSETPIPAGYVAVAVDEEFAEGKFVANLPGELSASTSEMLTGGVWEFAAGRLIRRSFRAGRRAFEAGYAEGGPGRDQPGYLVFGLNPKIRHAPWMTDQRLGVVTLGLGGNRYYGGTSGSSFRAPLHLSGSEVRVDGQVVFRAGSVH